MLNRLCINNVALISSLELEFSSGLNILSGETGAGKSIIVDSLMLLLGGKYDKTLLKFGQSEGFVEGYFSCVAPELFEEIGLEPDEDAIIKRRFSDSGRNDIRINGQTVTLSMLKKFASLLVDIYGQNEHQSLALPAKHLDILDYYAKKEIAVPLSELQTLTRDYSAVNKKLASIGDLQQRKRNIDILEFQISEINDANILEHEEEEIVEKRRLLLSSERIKTGLSEAANLLCGEGESISALCEAAAKSLGGIASLSATFEELSARLDAVIVEVNDISDTALDYLDGIAYEENDLDKLEKRLEIVRSMRRKYGDYAAMQKFLEQAKEDYAFLTGADEAYERLQNQKEALKRQIYSESQKISSARKKCADMLAQRVIAELSELGMKDSRFEIVFSPFPSLEDMESYISANGMDKAEFYLSANAGQPLLPLAKIISGGEMSRFMLALKVISSETDTVQTMIFDEIDSGISGRIGQVIAQKLARISRRRQVLCVTHLPQIAAMADEHYFIAKQQTADQTVTSVQKLSYSGTIAEISRLSGGQDISSTSQDNAKEIKKWSDAYKATLATN